jgi:hypothetical protein
LFNPFLCIIVIIGIIIFIQPYFNIILGIFLVTHLVQKSFPIGRLDFQAVFYNMTMQDLGILKLKGATPTVATGFDGGVLRSTMELCTLDDFSSSGI